MAAVVYCGKLTWHYFVPTDHNLQCGRDQLTAEVTTFATLSIEFDIARPMSENFTCLLLHRPEIQQVAISFVPMHDLAQQFSLPHRSYNCGLVGWAQLAETRFADEWQSLLNFRCVRPTADAAILEGIGHAAHLSRPGWVVNRSLWQR